MNKNLAICIPTYNRADKLSQCLNLFLPQVKKHRIPIYVSNNASQDSTLEVLTNFKEQYDLLFFSSNSSNIGPDANIYNVVCMSNTDYAWIFGDDDVPLPNSIDYLLGLITNFKEAPGCILLNYLLKDVLGKLQPQIKVSDNRKLPDTQFIHDYFIDIMFISSLIVDVKAWKNIDPQKYMDSRITHMGTISELMVEKDGIVVAQPCLINTREECTWFSLAPKIFSQNMMKLIDLLPKEYDDIKYKLKSERKLGWRHVLGWRSMGAGLEVYEYVKDDNLVNNCLNYIILKIPALPLKKLVQSVRVIKAYYKKYSEYSR